MPRTQHNQYIGGRSSGDDRRTYDPHGTGAGAGAPPASPSSPPFASSPSPLSPASPSSPSPLPPIQIGLVPNAYPINKVYRNDPNPDPPFLGEELPYMTPRVNNYDIPSQILYEKNPIEGYTTRLLDVYGEDNTLAFGDVLGVIGVFHNENLVIINITYNPEFATVSNYIMKSRFNILLSNINTLNLEHVHTLELVNLKRLQIKLEQLKMPNVSKIISVSSMSFFTGLTHFPKLENVYMDFVITDDAENMFATKEHILGKNPLFKHIYLYDVDDYYFFSNVETSSHSSLYECGMLKLADSKYTDLAVVDLLRHPTRGHYELSKLLNNSSYTRFRMEEHVYTRAYLVVDCENKKVENLDEMINNLINPAQHYTTLIIMNCLNESIIIEFHRLTDIEHIEFINCPNVKFPLLYLHDLNTENIVSIKCYHCPNIQDLILNIYKDWNRLYEIRIYHSNISHVHESLYFIAEKYGILTDITISNGRKLKYDLVLHAVSANLESIHSVQYNAFDHIKVDGEHVLPIILPDTVFPVMATDVKITVPDIPNTHYMYNAEYKEAIVLDILAMDKGMVSMERLNAIVKHIRTHHPETVSLIIQGYDIIKFPNLHKLPNLQLIRIVKSSCKLTFKIPDTLKSIICYHSPFSFIDTNQPVLIDLIKQLIKNVDTTELSESVLLSNYTAYTIYDDELSLDIIPDDGEIFIPLEPYFTYNYAYDDISVRSKSMNGEMEPKTPADLLKMFEYITCREPFMYSNSIDINEPDISLPNGMLSRLRNIDHVAFIGGTLSNPSMLNEVNPTRIDFDRITPPLHELPIQHMTNLKMIFYDEDDYKPLPHCLIDMPNITNITYNIKNKESYTINNQFEMEDFSSKFMNKHNKSKIFINNLQMNHYSIDGLVQYIKTHKQHVQDMDIPVPPFVGRRLHLKFQNIDEIYPLFMDSMNDEFIEQFIQGGYTVQIGEGIGPGAYRVAQETIIKDMEERIRTNTFNDLPMPKNIRDEYEGLIPIDDEYDILRTRVISRYNAEILLASFKLKNRYYDSGITIKDFVKLVPAFMQRTDFIKLIGTAWFGIYESHVRYIMKKQEGRQILLWMYADSIESKNDIYRKDFMRDYNKSYGATYLGLEFIPEILREKISADDYEDLSPIRDFITSYTYKGGIDIPYLVSKFEPLCDYNLLTVFYACSPEYVIKESDVILFLNNLQFSLSIDDTIKGYFIKHITNYTTDLTPETVESITKQYPTHSSFVRALLGFWTGISRLDYTHIREGKTYKILETDYRPDAAGSIFFPLTCHYQLLVNKSNFHQVIHNSDSFMTLLTGSFIIGMTAAG
jgi:hypothetical protein